MKILALDFSSAQRSVAVACGGSHVREVIETTPGHSTRPFAMIESALAEAGVGREEIECLAIGLGPGSYAGIRAAIAVAQGWQLARPINLLGVSSVEAIAYQAHSDGMRSRVRVIVDAQRGEFYLSDWDLTEAKPVELCPLRIVSRAFVDSLPTDGGTIVGPEVTKWFPQGSIVHPRAAVVARLADSRTEFQTGDQLEPVYLRETSFVKAPPPRAV